MRHLLAADALKPWQYRSWLSARDPQFALKAGRILDLYARTWNGVALGEDEYVDNLPCPPQPGSPRDCNFNGVTSGTEGDTSD